ncbi:MAG TPA: WXG100 family type VII secretion target [Ktedonobacterales bacterium]|nr:WXG100 family type VII secretion target [Ktedonobacterales bacterium]
MSNEIKVTTPDQLSAQAQIHQACGMQSHDTSGRVQSGHATLAGAWVGGGFEDCSQFMQEFSGYLTNMGDLHTQIGANLHTGQANYGQTEGANVKSFTSNG